MRLVLCSWTSRNVGDEPSLSRECNQLLPSSASNLEKVTWKFFAFLYSARSQVTAGTLPYLKNRDSSFRFYQHQSCYFLWQPTDHIFISCFFRLFVPLGTGPIEVYPVWCYLIPIKWPRVSCTEKRPGLLKWIFAFSELLHHLLT